MSLQRSIQDLLPELIVAAQAEYDAWEQDENGLDPELGAGGICDRIAAALGEVLGSHGIDSIEGGQDGDDHSWMVAYNETEAVMVDIPPHTYESGGGYRWKKRPGIQFSAEHFLTAPVDRSDITAD